MPLQNPYDLLYIQITVPKCLFHVTLNVPCLSNTADRVLVPFTCKAYTDQKVTTKNTLLKKKKKKFKKKTKTNERA